MYNYQQAVSFIDALTGDPSSPVTFQMFYDPKPPFPQKKLSGTWTATLDASMKYIDSMQEQYCGLYMCINETDGTGREESNITKLRAFFVDFDGQDEPQWQLPPHLIQKRDDTHGHAFWLIDAGDLDKTDWSKIQKQLSLFYGTDGQVVDPCRVLRVPGSLHFKDPQNVATYSITMDDSKRARYMVGDILNAHKLTQELQNQLDAWMTNRQNIVEGVGYHANDVERKGFISFLENAAYPAVDKNGGTHELYRVASYGHDHGVPLKDAIELMWEHYNPRCEPPWSDGEKDHFEAVIHRSYKYAKSEAGCKTARALFLSDPVPEPQCGWESYNKVLNQAPVEHIDIETARDKKSLRLTTEEAEILLVSLNAKSSHFDFARVFDGFYYDGINLVRFDKIFYKFNGRSWNPVDDELIKMEVQHLLSPYKPSDSMTSGVFRVICTLVTREPIDNNTWFNDSDKETSNTVVFRNGIVELDNRRPVMSNHTPNFFALNELPYDFKPGDDCPKWKAFLTSIWGDNEDLKRQLQQWMGYCLTGDVSLQKFALFKGKPRSGKGTITDIISEILGSENISAPALGDLNKDSALDKMSGSRVAMIPDAHNVHSSVRDAVLSKLKAITGEDDISFHRMYKGGVNMKFTCKIIISTNNMPEFIDPSGALVARMLVFPFTRSFVGKENTNLRHELREEISGILQWAIEGLHDLRANNNRFTEAACGIAEKDDIKEDMFPLGRFISEQCEFDPSSRVAIDDVYNVYRMWAVQQGIKSPMSPSYFVKCLRNSPLPIEHIKEGTKRFFTGLVVRENKIFDNVVNLSNNNTVQ